MTTLQLSEVAPYLMARAYLSTRDIVEEGLIIRDVSSRHRNYRVELPDGTGLQLKQGVNAETRMTVAREAGVYREITQLDAGLAAMLPAFRGFDEQRALLIMALVPKSEDLRVHHLKQRAFRPDIGASIGEVLARVHRHVPPAGTTHAADWLPPFLALYRPSVEIFRNASAANLELLRVVQAESGMVARLDVLRTHLKRESLLHNDVKWDNFLLSGDEVKLIDWEAASYGDAAWDLGAVFGQYLSAWIHSIPVSGIHPSANYAALAAYPLARMKPVLNACWTSYFTTRGLDATAATALLLRSVSMAAVRLLQSAYESSQFANQLTSSEILHVQLASNILERPADACRQLLGLPLRGA